VPSYIERGRAKNFLCPRPDVGARGGNVASDPTEVDGFLASLGGHRFGRWFVPGRRWRGREPAVPRFDFRFSPPYRRAGVLFGVTPKSSHVTVDDGRLVARFGPWVVETAVANVAGTEQTGPYSMLKTIGPAHLSLKDRGLTFATNGERGVCIRFREPIPGIDPLGRLRHPALTVTVADLDGLASALAAA
jgi:hypothetical protein